MELVTGAMSTLLPKLANLIKEEYNLHKCVRAEITFLKNELEYMEAALLKVAEAPIDQPPDPLVKLWARDVRELSYDLEDSIDAFMVHIENHAPTKSKTRSFRAFMERSMNLLRRGKIRHNVGVDIEDYKRRIKEVKERSDRYKVDNIPTKPLGPRIDVLRLSALYTEATKLVGTEKRSDELVKMLMEGDEPSKRHLKIVSICGFGGLGKTTLARIVYEKLKGQFDCGAIVSVSHSPNLKNILKNMLYGFTKCDISCDRDEEQLINELREFLQDKRYFIVIDDIWETRVWEMALQHAFIDNGCGSRLILTTRSLDVGKKIGAVYKLQQLTLAESRKLFDLRIFGPKENSLPNELAEVSEKILKKCDGVPLAIIMIASMLASGKEYTHKYWSNVYKIMGSGLEDSPDAIKDMRRILSISYYDLPPHLKTCMLYLSSYPEDYEIPTTDLILKWVGEGFIILKEQGKSFYEVGEDYIDELMNRSMIQPSYIDPDSEKVTAFRVHDMVLDLITHLSNEDGFLTTLDGQRPIHVPTKIRRLSLQTSDVKCREIIKEDVKKLSTVILDHVRSLMVSTVAFNFLPAHLSFSVLRLLDLSGCGQVDDDYFKGICILFHLRYLGLSFTSITEIPKEIQNLQLLQVLDVSGTLVTKLPSTFVQLRQLLYLYVEELTGIPDWFSSLEHLQALCGVITVESPIMLCNLTGLTELRHVQLKFNEWDESCKLAVLQCLSSLVSLEYLELHGCNGDHGSPCDRLMLGAQVLRNINMVSSTICAVPGWMSSLCALSILHITLLTLGEEDLDVLGSIPSLSVLKLFVQAEPTQGRDKKLVVINGQSFLCLEKFVLHKTVGVMFVKGAMAKLRSLELRFVVPETMVNLSCFDFGLQNLSSLVEISVWMNCHKASMEEVEVAKAAIRSAIDLNSNSPRLNVHMEKRVVLKVDTPDENGFKMAKEIVQKIPDVTEISINPKRGMLAVYGFMDPVDVAAALRKCLCRCFILSVGPAVN